MHETLTFAFDVKCVCISIAGSCAAMVGLGVGPQMLGRTIQELFPGPYGKKRAGWQERVAQTGTVATRRCRIRTRTGRFRYRLRVLPIWTIAGISGVLEIADEVERLADSEPGSNVTQVAAGDAPAVTSQAG